MAELIGIVSGIAGLVHLTLVVSQESHDYVQKVRNAPKTTSRYLQEVVALGVVLLRVEEVLSLPGVAAAVSADTDLLPKSLIEECQIELETIKGKLEKRITPGHGFASKLHAISWPFEEKEMKQFVEQLARWNSIFNSLATTCSLRISNDTLVVAKAERDDRQRSVVLDWIYSNASAIDNSYVFQNYCEDTCKWVLDDKDYRHWQDGDGRTLFCTGGPGVGKTTLTSFLVNYLTNAKSDAARVLYHYFDFRAESRHHRGVAVVRNLLRQLLEQYDHLPESILSLHEKSRQAELELTDKVWIDTFCSMISSSPQVFILIDGFDECPDRLSLSRFLRSLKHTGAKLYIAGRSPIDVAFDFLGHHNIEMLAPKSDLITYIQSRLEADEDLGSLLAKSLMDEFVATLIGLADGVFLLVKVALDNLTGFTTVRQIRNALREVPKDLRSAYQATFGRIISSQPVKRDLALKSLAWVLGSRRPLTMKELLQALAMERDDVEVDAENLTTPKAVISACLGYIEHNKSNDLVLLTHATVGEFLDHECTDALEIYSLDIARICVKYLAQPAFAREPCSTLKDLSIRLTDFPLLDYAASYWGVHAMDYQKELTVEICKLLHIQNTVSNAAQVFHYLRRTKGQFSETAFTGLPQAFGKMHFLALWGLKEIAVLESPSYDMIITPDSLGWTPLHWAAGRGHPEMLEFLLSRGADIESKDLRHWTPLFWAVFWSRLPALCYLADKGASIMSKDGDGNTPLHIAVSRGNPEICDELLRRNADWSVKSPAWGSPHDQAIRSQIPEIAGMFLDLLKPHPMADMAGHTSEETVLERAVAWFPGAQKSVFRATLEGETTAAERSDWPRPLLLRLEQYGKKLREKDPNRLTCIGSQIGYPWFAKDLINQDDYVAGVLAFAILTERTDMVKALIDTGVDLNKSWPRKYVCLYDYQFPTLLASYVGNVELIDLLISHGANLDVADYDGRSPLHYSAILGHAELARRLCNYRQLINLEDREEKSALHLVWTKLLRAQKDRRWHVDDAPVKVTADELRTFLDIAELLVENGGDLNHQNKFGNTTLHDAVQTGQVEAVQKLINLGADVNIRAHEGQFRDYESTGHSLDYNGHSPFTLACMNHDLGIASVLYDAGAVLPDDIHLRQPSLERAIADADLSALRTFFGFGSASHVAGNILDGIPLLVVAVRSLQWVKDEQNQFESDFRPPFVKPSKHIDPSEAAEKYGLIIDYLLRVGQDPNDAADNGSTALLEALEYEYNKDIVDKLLVHGANLQASRNDGENGLHIAAASGYIPYIKLFLPYKAALNQKTCEGSTPISLAAANGHEEVVRLLLEEDALGTLVEPEYDWLQLSQCYNAMKIGDTKRAHDLMFPTPPLRFVDRAGKSLLHLAADTGVEHLVSTVISCGIDINKQDKRGNTALHIAAASKTPNPAAIRLLVDSGADLEIRNFSGDSYGISRVPRDALALHLAAYAGNLQVVEALVDCFVAKFGKEKALGRGPSKQGSLQSTKASSSPNCSMSTLAVSCSHSPERYVYREPPFIDSTSDRCGRTALMCAVQAGDIAIVKHLVDMGANVNASGGRGSWGFNALDLALPLQKGLTSIDAGSEVDGTKSVMVELLESYGAEVFEW